MSMLSNQDLIRRVPLFAALTPAQAQSLAGAVTKGRFKKGSTLIEAGKVSNALYIILSGRAHVVMADDNGREVILAILHTGDYVGEMSLLDHEAHSATVYAEVAMDVLMLGRDDFVRCLHENAELSLAVMRGLVKRLRNADHKIGSLALTSVYTRVAELLKQLATPNGNGDMVIRDKISRQDIAKMVGASREMVSRVMKDFEEQGILDPLTGVLRIHERRAQPR